MMLATIVSENRSKIHSITTDTIVAVSTPPGMGGIGIVRLSGPEARRIADRIFTPSSSSNHWASHTLRHGYIVDPLSRQRLDEVLVSWMKAPQTYTREDIVEINCHGGHVPLQQILKLCLGEGASIADPGEFTKRAFLNGRIDLSQAEAVADMICAQTEAAASVAIAQLSGRLSDEIKALRQELLGILAHLEASLDFPEEELELHSRTEHLHSLRSIRSRLACLIETYAEGRILREGAVCVILGRPNVGKSSLLNQLLNQERAIVTSVPGTTRDTIEEMIAVGGFPVRLIDTAGITSTEDVVEQAGVSRSITALEGADLALLVLDGSLPLQSDDEALLSRLQNQRGGLLLVINKQDLPQQVDLDRVREALPAKFEINISATMGWGIDKLRQGIYRTLIKNNSGREYSSVLVTNARHHQALVSAKETIEAAIQALEQSLSLEFSALDIRQALDYLGEVTGENTPDELLERIFSQFCIGK